MTPLQYLVQNKSVLVKIARSQLPDALKDDAQDVVQDVALQFVAYEPPRIEDNKLSAYVGKAINNTCKALCRDTSRRMELRKANDDLIRGTYGYNTTVPDPADIYEASELEKELLGDMSDIEQSIFIQVIGKGVSYKKTAEELGMKEEAVRKHVSRIKKKFNGDRKNGK